MTRVYKILSAAEWSAAEAEGRFTGSAVDLKDGYIHLSTAAQASDTARLHFAGQTDLVLLELAAEDLGAALKWEPSRGGALFPHLYGPLDPARVTGVRSLTLNADGWPDPGPLAP
ncbi:MAG: DUF952 domain-containing protein [Caulobacteraceae bacterium]